MAKIDLTVQCNSGDAIKKMDKVTKAAERLKKAMDDVRDLEISINVVEHEIKWWQFWKK